MLRTIATRLTALEAARQARLQQWWASLTETEQQAEFEWRFGAGSWQWLETAVADLTPEEIETTTALWDRYEQWWETQP